MRNSPGWTICESPIGPLTVVAGAEGITSIHLSGHSPRLSETARQPMRDAVDQLEHYERPRVGAAIGRNPVPVMVACHRVIGADGSLTGYFGGLRRKQVLLDLEGVRLAGNAPGQAGPKDQLALL